MPNQDVDGCVRFLQQLIQTESLSGDEGALAGLVIQEMRKLGYDHVVADDVGNVIGTIKGRGEAPAMMLNSHLDHVDVGDESRWPRPPFGAEIHGDRVWGRGAMDIKGPLAAQIYGVTPLLQDKPAGDVHVTAVVQEEVGGLGARYLAKTLNTPLVVVGEATGNELRRGHRGRTELVLHVQGKSVHASIPDRGVNPIEVLAIFVSALNKMEMNSHEELGRASVAPTLLRTDQVSPNVVPGELWLTLDWRNVPGETSESIEQMLQRLADRSLIKGARADVGLPLFDMTSYTGFEMTYNSHHPSFILEEKHPALVAAKDAMGTMIDPSTTGVWKFATDAGHFAERGMDVIGFAPGEEDLAHTVNESIRIDDLKDGMRGNLALAKDWAPAFMKVS
jgi:succinyl-diaminopimelate desuccinylase